MYEFFGLCIEFIQAVAQCSYPKSVIFLLVRAAAAAAAVADAVTVSKTCANPGCGGANL